MYVAGKQARPDSGYSRLVYSGAGGVIGEVGDGNRKDIRNAVEAARAAAAGWAASTGYNRAQILYYVAENLSARLAEFAERLRLMTGASAAAAEAEVEASIERLFTFAAWADKFEGSVHATAAWRRAGSPRAVGVIGVACPTERPLLGLIGLVAPAVSMGNTVVVVPSERYPLSATDLYQVLDTSDVPAGVVNIVTGARDALAQGAGGARGRRRRLVRRHPRRPSRRRGRVGGQHEAHLGVC